MDISQCGILPIVDKVFSLDGWVCIYTVVINLSHIIFYFGWRVLRKHTSVTYFEVISILGESSFLGWRIWQDVCVCVCLVQNQSIVAQAFAFYTARGVVA